MSKYAGRIEQEKSADERETTQMMTATERQKIYDDFVQADDQRRAAQTNFEQIYAEYEKADAERLKANSGFREAYADFVRAKADAQFQGVDDDFNNNPWFSLLLPRSARE
jgi:ATPase subunit of ABC transporter with duplicated ATPase domains